MKISPSLVVTKAAAKLSRKLGRGGGQALPGLIAERIDPGLAWRIAEKLPNGVVLITGTNGKTTTTKLLVNLLAAHGELVLTNSTGSNLRRGIASALISAARLDGTIGQTIGVFEVDEANLRLVAGVLKPRVILVLNLFRDQLDRYGELDTTAAKIGEGIKAAQADVIFNADDPLVASLARYISDSQEVKYFGIDAELPKALAKVEVVGDSIRCTECNKKLIYDRIYYGHLGIWRCPTGHPKRPTTNVEISRIGLLDPRKSKFDLSVGNKSVPVTYALPGLYNAYNALAALAAANQLGVSLEDAVEIIENAAPAFGRFERIEIEGRSIYLLLIKNPAGFAQVLETFLLDKTNISLLIAINDLAADGRDVSWLWDVPVGVLREVAPKVIVSGIRAREMQMRLKYEEIKSSCQEDLNLALDMLIAQTPEGGTAYVLPTYTAMIGIRDVLSKRTHLEGGVR